MPKTMTIGNQTFNFPIQGENPNWGEEVTDWAEAVSDTLATIQGPYDILLTTVAIANNQTTAASITGFAFSSSFVRSFEAEYSVERSNNPQFNSDAGGDVDIADGSYGVSGDSITITGHFFRDNDPVTLSGTLPAGLVADTTTYYVIVLDANTIQLETSIGSGTAVNITATAVGTGTINYKRAEVGRILGQYNNFAKEWEIAVEANGDTGVNFSITTAGQLQYTSDEMYAPHSGDVKFKAKAIAI